MSDSLTEKVARRVLAEEDQDDYHKMVEFLNAKMKPLKGHGWWLPPHDLLVNAALMEMNLWQFSILPFFADKKAYMAPDNRRGLPEGLVIHPTWNSVKGHRYDHTLENAEKFLKMCEAQPSIHDKIKKELRWVETTFGVTIPPKVESELLADAEKVAARRWGVDRLRIKDVLVPFNGEKSIQLSS